MNSHFGRSWCTRISENILLNKCTYNMFHSVQERYFIFLLLCVLTNHHHRVSLQKGRFPCQNQAHYYLDTVQCIKPLVKKQKELKIGTFNFLGPCKCRLKCTCYPESCGEGHSDQNAVQVNCIRV